MAFDIESTIRQAIADAVHTMVDEEIEAAQRRLDKKIRERIGAVVIAVLGHVDIERDRKHLVITVRDEIKPL